MHIFGTVCRKFSENGRFILREVSTLDMICTCHFEISNYLIEMFQLSSLIRFRRIISVTHNTSRKVPLRQFTVQIINVSIKLHLVNLGLVTS